MFETVATYGGPRIRLILTAKPTILQKMLKEDEKFNKYCDIVKKRSQSPLSPPHSAFMKLFTSCLILAVELAPSCRSPTIASSDNNIEARAQSNANTATTLNNSLPAASRSIDLSTDFDEGLKSIRTFVRHDKNLRQGGCISSPLRQSR